jgi:hypothetical protein
LAELFEYGGGSKFCGYIGTNAELLCVEFFNFVQCDVFISYLSYIFINGVLDIRDTNTAAEKYTRLNRPVNLFIFLIYKMGKGSRL